MQWVFRCDVRRLALSIIPDDDDEMSPALCPSLSPKSYLSSSPSFFCSTEKLNDLLRGEKSAVHASLSRITQLEGDEVT